LRQACDLNIFAQEGCHRDVFSLARDFYEFFEAAGVA
jgi:hypothetical protein